MLFAKLIEKKYREVVFSRQEARDDTFYFSHKNFENLSSEPFEFNTDDGIILRGSIYSYPNAREGELVIFDHGMGAGHLAYMREIERIAKLGYRVFSYDHTGCATSGGEGTLGFARSLSDLDAAIRTIKGDERFSGVRISVVGHSWGGFAAMNIAKYHSDIKSIVSISGFISVKSALDDILRGILSLYKKHLYRLECKTSGSYAEADARGSLAVSSANVLIIHSEDDCVISCKNNFSKLKEALGGRENIRFLLVDGKRHNPNYTKDAVDYKDSFIAELSAHRKNLHTDDENQAFVEKFDWYKMTEQDDAIFDEISKTLDK